MQHTFTKSEKDEKDEIYVEAAPCNTVQCSLGCKKWLDLKVVFAASCKISCIM